MTPHILNIPTATLLLIALAVAGFAAIRAEIRDERGRR